jgi:YVTN family beta-propeller protein
VSVIDLGSGRQLRQIEVGLHPSGLAISPGGRYLCVANANSDTVSVIDTKTDEVCQTFSTRPEKAPKLFGSGPNALTFDSEGRTLYVSNGTNNAIALFSFDPAKCRWQGCLPTAWYPAGLVFDRARCSLYVANVKGWGSRSTDWQGRRKVKGKVVFGYASYDHSGTISLVPLPNAEDLAAQTERVFQNNRVELSRGAMARPNRQAKPRPVPAVAGEPSLFKHVLYIIKENRTYDQVFGDVKRGEGDPNLCIFGRKATPNQHKIVDDFVLLDNFYCSGVLSADGHQWTDEAYVTDYIEKSFGGFPRSYPFDGGDALAYASSGFLWDAVLARGKSLRVYGEFVAATVRWKDRTRDSKPKFLDCLHDFEKRAGEIEVLATAAIKTIEPHLCPTFIGFPSTVPDVYRAEQFVREFQQFDRLGKVPTLMVMSLPNNHTSGTTPGFPTPEASVADNDLALGRIVEAVSKSRSWKETCIFVVEDDPQNGFDHIDGHRTAALVISPYSRLGKVDSTNYNQTSMVRTIELVLGLPPMNQFDASATPMSGCFGERGDLTPFASLPNQVPLDRMNPELSQIRDPRQRHWAEVSLGLPLDDVDEADEDTLNRILWHSVRGRDDTYPAWAVNETE